MILTLHRSRWLVYHGDYVAVDTYEWSFARVDPTRSIGAAAGCVITREPDGERAVQTPPLAKLVEIDVHDGKGKVLRTVARLAFHTEPGLGPESVIFLAMRGERGFRMAKY